MKMKRRERKQVNKMAMKNREPKCKDCGKLAPDKEAADMGFKNYWRCSAGGFDVLLPIGGPPVPGCWAWRTICKPGKAVAAAQKDCLVFEVRKND